MSILTAEPENKEKQLNTYTTYTKKIKSPINTSLQAVEVKSSSSTTPIPSYTNKLQGEEKLSSDDVYLLASMNENCLLYTSPSPRD